MVKTIDTDGRVLVLRPDVTLPVVETAAREFPRANQLIKFGYVSTVFREYYGRSTYGKDFLQGGIEILGDSSPECDGEVIVTAAEILKAVGVENIRIDIGTAAYTQALFEGLPISAEQKDTLKRYMAERNLVACKSYIESLSLSAEAREASSPCRSYSVPMPRPSVRPATIRSTAACSTPCPDWKPFTTISSMPLCR